MPWCYAVYSVAAQPERSEVVEVEVEGRANGQGPRVNPKCDETSAWYPRRRDLLFRRDMLISRGQQRGQIVDR
jgi:hypothetical protein